MTKWNRLRWAPLLLAFVSLISRPTLPFPAQEDISIYRERLAKIEQEKEATQRLIDELDRRKTSILSQLDRIGLEKKLILEELTEYDVRMRQANTELEAIQKQIPPLQERLKEEKEDVAKTLVSLYKFGNIS